MQHIQNAVGRVSFTMDVWSSKNSQPYLAITAHYIARVGLEGTTSLRLKASLIAFHRICGTHDGVSLARTVIDLLDRAGVTVKVGFYITHEHRLIQHYSKVGHFTMDNASNNITMMKELGRLLQDRDIDFDCDDRRIMCFAHVVDLSTGRVIDNLSRVKKPHSENWNEPLEPTEPTYAKAMARDIVRHARTVVRMIRGSGMRRDAFSEVIENGNSKDWFKDGQPPKIIRVKKLQLLRAVPTRWDSEYYMLNRLRELRPVCLLSFVFRILDC
jgi:hypothetical protein